VGKMAKKKKEGAKKVSVKVLDRKRMARVNEIRVVVKGGRIFTFRISRPVLDGKKLVLHDESGVIMVTSLNKLPRDIEEYFKMRGMEPLYIYPAYQHTIV